MDKAEEVIRSFVREARKGELTERAEVVERAKAMVREDSPDGFRVFYELVRHRPLPRHCREWVAALYAAREQDMFFGAEAFRGSTKTTTLTETFTAYRIGLEPHKSNLFVQGDDKQAAKHSGNVADIITRNPSWRLFFPNVIPDEAKGWGAQGYWVIDKDREADWQQLRAKDPTLVGVGYTDTVLTGSHPTGLLAIDDINTDKNTRSDARNIEVNSILTDTLYPITEDPGLWHTFCQTPWTRNDALALAKGTGVYRWVKTPVMRICDKKDEGAKYIEVADEGIVSYSVWAKPAWPEKFGPERIAKAYRKSGAKGFAKAYMLDLKSAEGMNLKREWLHDFPAERIGSTWPAYIGIDYASTSDHLRDKERDYFGLAVTRGMPGGGLVIQDGIRERLSRGEAEAKVRAYAYMYPTLVNIGVEMDGKGEEFYNQLASIGTLPVIPLRTQGRSKGFRFESVMAKHFEFSRVWVSDGATPFLTTFRDEWVSWDGTQKTHDDTLDAVYYALASAGLFLIPTEASTDVPSPWFAPKKQANPFASLGATHGP